MTSRVRQFAVLVMAAGAIASCSGQSNSGSQSRTTTTTAKSTPVVGWSGAGIRTICVEASATFEGEPRSTANVSHVMNLNYAEIYGVKLVTVGRSCDAMLRIEFGGMALSAEYKNGVLYTGRDVRGQVTLAAQGQPTIALPLAVRDEPPNIAVFTEGDPPAAPSDALDTGDLAAWWRNAVEQFFGPYRA